MKQFISFIFCLVLATTGVAVAQSPYFNGAGGGNQFIDYSFRNLFASNLGSPSQKVGAIYGVNGTLTGTLTLTNSASPTLTSGGLNIWNVYGRTNPVTWIDTLLLGAYAYLEDLAMVSNVTTTGQPALFGASRTSDVAAITTCCAMGVTGAAINDDVNANNAQTAWPGYFTGARIANTGAVQFEIDVANVSNDVVDISPYSGTTNGPPGSTVPLNLGCGGEPPVVGNTPNGKCSALLYFNNNGSISRKGLVARSTLLDTSIGAGGNGVFLELASGQSIRWLKSDGTTLAEIWGDANGPHFKPPTSCTGHATGDLYNNSGTPAFCP